MTGRFNKLSIAGLALVLLTACSFINKKPADGPASIQVTRVNTAGALAACPAEPGSPFSYRKVILVAGTIGIPDQIRDLPGLASLTSRRLQEHLDRLDRFKVPAMHDTSFESRATTTAERVRQIGQQYGSQFVVKLDIQDLTIHSPRGWLARLAGASARRDVLITLYIYDAEFGALFHSQRYERNVSGDVVGHSGNGGTVTNSWFNTDLGQQIDDILVDMSRQVNEKVACIPFSTRVTAVRGKDIHINAGFLHGIRPGDFLRVYPRRDLAGPEGTQKRDKDEGWIRIVTVLPDRSIATAAQDNAGGIAVSAYDVVRAW